MSAEDKRVLEERINAAQRRERRKKMREKKNKIKKETGEFMSDFRKFISKGNVLDLAVAVVVAAAFNAIVNGLVTYIIMPVTAYFTSGIVVYEWEYVLREAYVNEAGREIAKLSIQYGLWFKTVIDFLIIALSVFVAVRILRRIERRASSKIHKKEAEAAAKKKAEDEKKAAEAAEQAAEAERQRQEAERKKQEREDAIFENLQEQTRLLRRLAGENAQKAEK